MNKPVFGTTIGNARNHEDVKLISNNYRRGYLASQTNYRKTKWFPEDLLAVEMNKAAVMRKPVYLGMSKLNIGKTVMYLFWYDYIKPKYNSNSNLFYMDTDTL